MEAVVRNSINLLAFLLGLSLAFVPFSYASTLVEQISFMSSQGYTCYWSTCSATKKEVYCKSGNTKRLFRSYDPYDSYTVVSVGSSDVPYFDSGCVLDPVEPANCSNNVKDVDEDGINCGGVCSDACDSSICENQSAILSDGLCSEHTFPDAFGNCPSGTTLIFTDDANVCATSPVPAIQYFSGDLQDPSGDVVDDGFFAGVDFSLSGVDDPFESGQVSFIQDPEIVVDNGDGTETATVKKYTKRLNPKTGLWETVSSGSASVSRTVNSPSGTGFVSGSSGVGIAPGFSGETEDDIPMEATPLIAAPDGLDFGDKLTDLLNSSSAEFESYVDDVQGSDLVQHFTDVFTLPDDPGDTPLTISMGAYGVHLVDSQMMDTTLSLVGQVLVVCAFIAGAYIVFRKQ